MPLHVVQLIALFFFGLRHCGREQTRLALLLQISRIAGLARSAVSCGNASCSCAPACPTLTLLVQTDLARSIRPCWGWGLVAAAGGKGASVVRVAVAVGV